MGQNDNAAVAIPDALAGRIERLYTTGGVRALIAMVDARLPPALKREFDYRIMRWLHTGGK